MLPMPAPGAAQQERSLPPRFASSTTTVPYVAVRPTAVAAVSWAVVASTWQRIRRGEGALLAINFSLIAHGATDVGRAVLQALVSTLAMLAMYAFNDLYDAPDDWKNPKKDRALIATWIEHRQVGIAATFFVKLAAVALALALGPLAAAAVAAVLIVNVAYSTVLKGVPVADVAVVWLWGALYAAIVSPSTSVLVLVGVMTGICHLFQVLDDREADAANGIVTTAVCSAALSRNVLTVFSALLFLALRSPLGVVGATTAFTPLVMFFAVGSASHAWLLTKVYFAVMWLYVLRASGAYL